MPRTYDVIIVGAGPAGIFCALELTRNSDMKVLLLDKGEGLDKRKCPAPSGACRKCQPCATLTGWGGAGAFSDGKLTLSSKIGGWLS
ncbi:MAG: FAD-dependent oxidoreductase, partial [Candidatus Geothermincolia bacterium]